MNLSEAFKEFSGEFDRRCQERHDMGAEKYGPSKFLEVDTLQEALDEIVDLSNYARYTFIKIRILQAELTQTMRPDFTKDVSS